MYTLTKPKSDGTKNDLYQQLCGELRDLLGSEENLVANAANAAALLFHSLPDVNWVGFYLTEGDDLVLGPFQGRPACVRIPFGKGVCGTAALQGEPIVVSDVRDFPDHIACDVDSKSEIVVPLVNWGKVLGVLDVDSPSLNRFDEDDLEGLESFVAVFVSCQVTSDLPDFSDGAIAGSLS